MGCYLLPSHRVNAALMRGCKNNKLWLGPKQCTEAYPGFCDMKRLGVFILLPGWDASPTTQS